MAQVISVTVLQRNNTTQLQEALLHLSLHRGLQQYLIQELLMVQQEMLLLHFLQPVWTKEVQL